MNFKNLFHTINPFSIKETPKDETVACTIKTPQFRGSQEDFWMKTQTGVFNYNTMVFTPDTNPENDEGEVGKHRVQFHSESDFRKARIK